MSQRTLLQYASSDMVQQRLTDNPTDTYFKQGRDRFSRYVMETGILGSSSGGGFDEKYSFRIVGNASDYLVKCHLRIKLPSLKDYPNYAWVNKIGYYIIENAKFRVGPTVISEITGKYLDLHQEAFENIAEKTRTNILIGNTPDMVIPKNYNPSDPNYLNYTYGYYKDVDASGNVSGLVDGPDETMLFVDLKFYFSRDTSLAFPLAKLGSKNHAEIIIKLASLDKILRSFDTTASEDTKVTISDTMKNELNSKLTQSEVHLLVDYAWVTNEEKQLLFNTEEFPIIQTKSIKYEINANEKDPSFPLDITENNIQEILFCVQRNDILENNDQSHKKVYNDHTNFTTDFSKSVLPDSTNKLAHLTGNYNHGPGFLDSNKDFVESSQLYFGNAAFNYVSNTITNLINPGKFNALSCIGVHLYSFTINRNIIGNSLYTGENLGKDLRLNIANNSEKTTLFLFVNTISIMKLTNSGGIMIVI